MINIHPPLTSTVYAVFLQLCDAYEGVREREEAPAEEEENRGSG